MMIVMAWSRVISRDGNVSRLKAFLEDYQIYRIRNLSKLLLTFLQDSVSDIFQYHEGEKNFNKY